MNVKAKILIPSLVAMILMLMLGVVSFLGLRSAQQALDEVATKGMVNTETLNESRSELFAANVGTYRLFATMGSFDAERIKKETETILAHVDHAIKSLATMSTSGTIGESEIKVIAALAEPVAKYRKNVAQAIDMADSDLAAGTGMMQAADKRFVEIAKQLDAMIGEQKIKADALLAAASARSTSSIITNIGVFVIGLVVAISISLLLAGKIVGSLRSAIHTASSIAGGQLTNDIDTSGRDETGELLRTLASMQDSLRQLIGQISRNVNKAGASRETMAGALGQITHSVTGQNNATAAVAAAVEQMSASMGDINSNASQALSVNKASSALADQGGTVIQSAFDEMTRIASTVKDAARVVEDVGRQSQEISTIVGVIREVADQTNLLALNAAIEAARAGESGRGFAVVADEVRKLAEKTTRSSQEISRMIASIQDSSGQAVRNIHQVVKQVETTADYAGNARDSIKLIQTNVGQSMGFAQDIASAIENQSLTSNLIAQQVEEISRMSEKSAQNVADVGQAMYELEADSKILQTAVARFTV